MGSGGTETASLGSGETETASKGSGEISLICLAPSREVSVGANFLALGIPTIDTRQEPTTKMKGHDPYEFVYAGLPKTHHVLKKVQNCFYYRAKRFEGEGPSFCCRNGRVSIFIPKVPNELHRLFTSQTDWDAKYFRRNIRYFNSHFSFTSMGFPLIVVWQQRKVLAFIHLKLMAKYITSWINLYLINEDHAICNCTFMTQMRLCVIGSKGLHTLTLM